MIASRESALRQPQAAHRVQGGGRTSFYWRATLFVIALYIFAYSVFTIGRYERYNATGFDLATYDQVLWRTAHGDLMGVSIEGNNVTNWAIHVEPILLLLA